MTSFFVRLGAVIRTSVGLKNANGSVTSICSVGVVDVVLNGDSNLKASGTDLDMGSGSVYPRIRRLPVQDPFAIVHYPLQLSREDAAELMGFEAVTAGENVHGYFSCGEPVASVGHRC